VHSHGTGEAVAKVGEIGHGLIIVLAGKVSVTLYDGSGRCKPIVTIFGCGAFAGETCLFEGSAGIRRRIRKEWVQALVFPRARFGVMLVADGEIGDRIMRAPIERRVDLVKAWGGGPVIVGGAGSRNALSGFCSISWRASFRNSPAPSCGTSASLQAGDYFNRDPVVHTWTYRLDKAA
jgi:thioredoxin reductase (NADPH)